MDISESLSKDFNGGWAGPVEVCKSRALGWKSGHLGSVPDSIADHLWDPEGATAPRYASVSLSVT